MNKKQKNREEHAAAIKRKYFMENKHIKVFDIKTYDNPRVKPPVFISSKNDFGYHMLEIRAPHTLDKVIKLLKENKMIVHDLDEDRKYTFEDYVHTKMILRLAGVE